MSDWRERAREDTNHGDGACIERHEDICSGCLSMARASGLDKGREAAIHGIVFHNDSFTSGPMEGCRRCNSKSG
jgi:hypothetical protein